MFVNQHQVASPTANLDRIQNKIWFHELIALLSVIHAAIFRLKCYTALRTNYFNAIYTYSSEIAPHIFTNISLIQIFPTPNPLFATTVSESKILKITLENCRLTLRMIQNPLKGLKFSLDFQHFEKCIAQQSSWYLFSHPPFFKSTQPWQ
jgi:hypothetical protein